MKIDFTEFGSITVNSALYTHDILIQLSGEVVKRKKRLSKKCQPHQAATTVHSGRGCDGQQPCHDRQVVAFGSGSAVEKIRKLPFGEISWPMYGNDPIADVVG